MGRWGGGGKKVNIGYCSRYLTYNSALSTFYSALCSHSALSTLHSALKKGIAQAYNDDLGAFLRLP
uniref:Uncharacterized protein n=1 Tax=Desertifilum tharense IPPAS B-1220 TaxID=1781255 RepID=A0ACD5GVF5_9CYAN